MCGYTIVDGKHTERIPRPKRKTRSREKGRAGMSTRRVLLVLQRIRKLKEH